MSKSTIVYRVESSERYVRVEFHSATILDGDAAILDAVDSGRDVTPLKSLRGRKVAIVDGYQSVGECLFWRERVEDEEGEKVYTGNLMPASLSAARTLAARVREMPLVKRLARHLDEDGMEPWARDDQEECPLETLKKCLGRMPRLERDALGWQAAEAVCPDAGEMVFLVSK